jgi:hypothetical protein
MNNTVDGGAMHRREARARRVAVSMGLCLQKSRARDACRMDFGCYRIVSSKDGRCVAGTYPYAYSLDLDGVEEVLEELLENPPASKAALAMTEQVHGCEDKSDPRWVR